MNPIPSPPDIIVEWYLVTPELWLFERCNTESHLSVTFIAAGIVRSCYRALVRAMFIRAGIVRDLVRELVRDHVRAAHVKATLVRANLLRHIIYSLIHKVKDWLDLRFNRGGSEGEVGSTKSPSELNRAGIHSSQPGLLDLVRAVFIRTGIVRYHVRVHVKAVLVRATLVRATFIRTRIVRDYVRVHLSLISKMYFSHWKPPGVSEKMWSVNLDVSISGEYQTLGGHFCRPSE